MLTSDSPPLRSRALVDNHLQRTAEHFRRRFVRLKAGLQTRVRVTDKGKASIKCLGTIPLVDIGKRRWISARAATMLRFRPWEARQSGRTTSSHPLTVGMSGASLMTACNRKPGQSAIGRRVAHELGLCPRCGLSKRVEQAVQALQRRAEFVDRLRIGLCRLHPAAYERDALGGEGVGGTT